MTFAQNQNEKKVTIDNLKIEVIVTKDASDEVLEKYVKMFAKYDVQLDFGKIKRNATNEITSISISLNHQDRLETKSKIKNNSPINSQKIYLKIDEDKISDLGIYTLLDSSEEQKPSTYQTPKIIKAVELAESLWINDEKYEKKDLLNKSIVFNEISEKNNGIYITGRALTQTEADKFKKTEGWHKFSIFTFNDKGNVIYSKIEKISLGITD
jgi:hypothetical protein